MLSGKSDTTAVSAQAQLLDEITSYTTKRISRITVSDGKIINRNISGGIFILSGHAVLYKKLPKTEKRIFLDRLSPGRLFYEEIIQPHDPGTLELVAEGEVQIAVANLKQLKQTNRVISEKISNALFEELGITCQGAMEQICTLRNGSAKQRLLRRAQQVAQVAEKKGDGEWIDLGVSPDLFLDMSGVSSRQFSRLLPELEKEEMIKVSEGAVLVKHSNIHVLDIA